MVLQLLIEDLEIGEAPRNDDVLLIVSDAELIERKRALRVECLASADKKHLHHDHPRIHPLRLVRR